MLRSKLSVAAGIVIGVIVARTIAWAAIPAADGSITACYRQRASLSEPKGALRVVDSPSQCTSGETALTWNQQGQPGPEGPAGPEGLRGPAGEDGIDGQDGTPGLPGQDGIDGQDGTSGLPGRDGIDGQDGAPGPAGRDGIDGQDGAPGPAGISGARFVPAGFAMLPDSGDFVQIATTTLPRGSYVVIATVTGLEPVNDENTLICHLRHGDSFIGGQTTGLAEAYQDIIQHEADYASLTVTGGAALDDGGTISLWCRAEGHDAEVMIDDGHMMILQVGGFI